MDSLGNRKKELSDILTILGKTKLEEEELKTLCSYCFPRLYGHYEKFMEEAFIFLIDEIYENTVYLAELKEKILYFFLYISFDVVKKNESYFKAFLGLDGKSKLKVLNKEVILKHFKQNVAREFIILSKLLDFSDNKIDDNIKKIELKCGILGKKFEARCRIVHGHIEIDDMKMTLDEIKEIKKIIEDTIDLLSETIAIYLEEKLYKKII
ncbi:MAG: MAE_28990/MAE_18760 family HEPN-like nuclease [Fusobacteriaceae bacterium]